MWLSDSVTPPTSRGVEGAVFELLPTPSLSLPLPPLYDDFFFLEIFLARFFSRFVKLKRFYVVTIIGRMKPNCGISLSLQGSEHRRHQKFILEATQNRNFQLLGLDLKQRPITCWSRDMDFQALWIIMC